MASSYVILIFLFICSPIFLHAERNNLIVGKNEIDDQVYAQRVLEKKQWGRILDFVREIAPFRDPWIRNITMIRALDQNLSGHGGKASILDINNGTVKMRFVSERSHGIDFIVEIYGK